MLCLWSDRIVCWEITIEQRERSRIHLAFECISDYDQRFCGVYDPQFVSRNDKHIVKNDDNILIVGKDWSWVQWQHFDDDRKNCTETGAYIICNNGYLQWPTPLCSFMRSETNGLSGKCEEGHCVWYFEGKVWISQLWFQTSPDLSLQMGFSCMLCYSQHDAGWDEKRTTNWAIEMWQPNAGFGNVVIRSNGIVGKLLWHEFHQRRNLLAKHVWWWNVKCKNWEIVPTAKEG